MNLLQISITVLVLALLGTGAWFWFSYNRLNNTLIPATTQVSLTGTIECLPHDVAPGTPTTMECMYGLHDPVTNNYYRLQSNTALGVNATEYPVGTAVIVEGTFSPQTDTEYKTIGSVMLQKMTKVDNTTSTGNSTAQTTSDGTITFAVPANYGLAVTKEQVLNTAVIPPCADGFNYCLYYTGDAYKNTNLQSAGVSITKKASSSTAADCLVTAPAGYLDMRPSATSSQTDYQMTVFSPLSEGAAGSGSAGEEYRLFTSNTCYAIMTQIGFSNVQGSSSLEVLTQSEKDALLSELRNIVSSILITATGETLALPKSI